MLPKGFWLRCSAITARCPHTRHVKPFSAAILAPIAKAPKRAIADCRNIHWVRESDLHQPEAGIVQESRFDLDRLTIVPRGLPWHCRLTGSWQSTLMARLRQRRMSELRDQDAL